jgi:hypothetical protein
MTAKRKPGDKTPKAKPGKAIAKVTPAQTETRATGWELEGMSPEQVEEATAIKARVDPRPNRPSIFMTGEKAARALSVGNGSEADKVLHSMRLFDVLGSRSNGFIDDSLHRIAGALRLTGDDNKDSTTLSAAVAMVAAVAPTNELEATMALQMVAANEAAMMGFERSRMAQYLEHASAYSNMANKAMRSFALHAEAIAKLRRGGEQVVKHVHVNDGGQAVIAGTVNTGRGA